MKNLFLAFIFVLILSVTGVAQNQGGSSSPLNIFNTAMQQVQKTVAGSRIFNSKSSGEMLRKKPAQKTTAAVRGKTPAKTTRPANNTVARNRTKTAPSNKQADESDEPVEETYPEEGDETTEATTETDADADAVSVETTFAGSDSQILVDKLFAQANMNDPQVALLKEVVIRGWNDYKETSAQRGYQHNDLARAVSYYIGTNYNVYHNTAVLTPDQSRALYNQLKQHLSANEEIAKLKDEDKQLFSELLVFMTSIPVFMNAVGANQGNQELVTQSRTLAKQNVENLLGMKIEKVRFTASGMEMQQ